MPASWMKAERHIVMAAGGARQGVAVVKLVRKEASKRSRNKLNLILKRP